MYSRYQASLKELHWADSEESAWLGIAEFDRQTDTATDIRLLIVDGFDSFDNSQHRILELLAQKVGELIITIPGTDNSERSAHRRFQEGIEKIKNSLGPNVTRLENPPFLSPILQHLEQNLFESNPATVAEVVEPLLLEVRSPANESREVLRWIKKQVIRKKTALSDCAIFTPDAAIYNPLLKAVADEFGIPVRFTLDETLFNSPSITALMNLLTLPASRFNSHYLINVLRSPYFDFSLDAERINTMEMVSRVGIIIEGQDQWMDVWARLAASTEQDHLDLDDERNAPALPRGQDALKYQREMKTVFQMIVPPAEDKSQTEWIHWLEDLLENLHFYEKADNERDRPSCEVFRDILRSLVLSEAIAGDHHESYLQFLTDLQSAVNSEGFREIHHPGQDKLLIGRMKDARGTRFKTVAIMGLSEGSFPANAHPDPFLDEELRSDLGLESILKRDQTGLFYQGITRPDKNLLITRPYMSEDGEDWEESVYWNAITILLSKNAVERVSPETIQPLTEAGSTQELLFTAVRQKSLPKKYTFLEDRWHNLQQAHKILSARRAQKSHGPYEGITEQISQQLDQRYSPSMTWSSSRLETFSNCPFQFFVRHLLELEPKEQPTLDMDASQLGSILHRILELTFKNASNPHDLNEILQSLQTEAENVFATAPIVYGFRPSALWKIKKEHLLEKLKISVSALTEDSNWTPIAYEKNFGIKGTPPLEIDLGDEKIKIRGVIDRVDENSNGHLRVVDYKSGSSHLAASDLENGTRLQLPIYALAVRDALHLGIPIDGFYWKILAGEASSIKLAKFSTEYTEGMDGMDAAILVLCEHLLRIVRGVRSGEFSPVSPDGGCPDYCPAAQWCWRFEPGW